MNKKTLIILVFGLIGLLAGYLIFAKVGGSYLSVKSLLSFSGGDFGSFGRKLTGIRDVQIKVLLSLVVGVVIGLVYLKAKKK